MISLKETFKDLFLVGAAVSPMSMKQHDELIRQHFSSLTAENCMKPDSVMRGLDQYDFTQADELAAYAKRNDIALRGHTLVWHNQTPRWFFRDGKSNASRETMLARLDRHIAVMAERYAQCYAWDVVNEAISDHDGEMMRQSPWTQTVGEDFVTEAFRIAARYLPKGSLFYNDYNACFPEKRSKIITLVSRILDAGIPVDGIGLQGHWNINVPTLDSIGESLLQYSKLGVKLHVTELDISVKEVMSPNTNGQDHPTDEQREKQAEKWEQVFRLFREFSSSIECVTCWGVTDDTTWLDGLHKDGFHNEPMLFDVNEQPKECFRRICDVVGCK